MTYLYLLIAGTVLWLLIGLCLRRVPVSDWRWKLFGVYQIGLGIMFPPYFILMMYLHHRQTLGRGAWR